MATKKGILALLILVVALAGGTLVVLPPAQPQYSGCGPRSLVAVARALGKPVSEAEAFGLFSHPQNDVSFAEIAAVAPRLDLRATGYRMDVTQLRIQKPLGILHVSGTHFVGLVGYSEGAFEVAEPGFTDGIRYQRWTADELAARWDGTILILENNNSHK